MTGQLHRNILTGLSRFGGPYIARTGGGCDHPAVTTAEGWEVLVTYDTGDSIDPDAGVTDDDGRTVALLVGLYFDDVDGYGTGSFRQDVLPTRQHVAQAVEDLLAFPVRADFIMLGGEMMV